MVRSARLPGFTRGFTLLEVLIALGLSVVLISAVYGAVEMYYRYQNAGRAEIRGQQLLRSITRLMARDISCLVQPPPEPQTAPASTGQAAGTQNSGSTTSGPSGSSGSASSNSTGAASSATSSSGTGSFSGSSFDAMAQGGTTQAAASGTATTFLGLEEAGLPVIFGLVGTSELLHLTVSLPSRELNYQPPAVVTTPEERSGDLQVITIGLTTIDTISMSLLQKNLKISRPGLGLGRRVRDLYSQFATDEALEPQHLIAPEITELNFRYFDSGEWFGDWDSVAMGRLPRAVEVDFGFWNPPPTRIGRSDSRESGTVTHVQYVFQVPLSVPIVE